MIFFLENIFFLSFNKIVYLFYLFIHPLHSFIYSWSLLMMIWYNKIFFRANIKKHIHGYETKKKNEKKEIKQNFGHIVFVKKICGGDALANEMATYRTNDKKWLNKWIKATIFSNLNIVMITKTSAIQRSNGHHHHIQHIFYPFIYPQKWTWSWTNTHTHTKRKKSYLTIKEKKTFHKLISFSSIHLYNDIINAT